MEIQFQLQRMRARIESAARAAGRSPSDIRLIAVSKTHSAEDVREASSAGQKDFAENRIQEAVAKIERVDDIGLTWHFIGHLQSNKARHVPGKFVWLHTLDSLDLASKLSNAAITKHTRLNCLIQVNVTGDQAKAGIAPASLPGLVEAMLSAQLDGITLRGLMTIGPHGGSEPELRTCFGGLRSLQARTQSEFGLQYFDQLSMGMTEDLEAAILEGATMIRIGTGIKMRITFRIDIGV